MDNDTYMSVVNKNDYFGKVNKTHRKKVGDKKKHKKLI